VQGNNRQVYLGISFSMAFNQCLVTPAMHVSAAALPETQLHNLQGSSAPVRFTAAQLFSRCKMAGVQGSGHAAVEHQPQRE
jgi:hypothetical protein